MKAVREPINQIGDKAVKPYSLSNPLIGLQMDGVDQQVLEYFNYFAKLFTPEKASFLHVATKPDIFNIDEISYSSPLHDIELDLDLEIQLGKTVKSALQDNKNLKLSLDVEIGRPLEEILEKAEAIKTDLVIIGQNTEKRHHGILAKNLARQVWSNSLIVPGNSKPSLTSIIVPVDFSIPSAEAMRIAVGMRKRHPQLRITLVHIYEMPVGLSDISYDVSKVAKLIENDRQNSLRQFVNDHLPNQDKEGLETVILNAGHQGTGQRLVEYAEKNKHDLIIMGSKGHSKLALLLMGSMTEKVVSQTESIPILIVK